MRIDIKKLKKGRASNVVNHGRPRSTRPKNIIENVRATLTGSSCASVRRLSLAIKISRTPEWRIIEEDLNTDIMNINFPKS